MELNRTIIAPATPLNKGAIAILRISGPKTYLILNQIFSKKIVKLKNQKYQLIFGYIKNDSKIIDQVMLGAYFKPCSFSGEDMVEIFCHGNVMIVTEILNLTFKLGARLAKNGEFSQQAFFNNKMSLIKANAVNDLINANNSISKKVALNKLINNNESVLIAIKNKIFNLIAQIEINIDYPEYEDVKEIFSHDLIPVFTKIKSQLIKIHQLSLVHQKIKNGIKVAIIGKPNVGKSLLLNKLAKEEKAIVTTIPGTTTDLINTEINLGKVTLNITDTAGIRKAVNEIEEIGILRSKKELKNAEIVFLMLDDTRKINNWDLKLLQQAKKNVNKFLILVNKIDLNKKIVTNYFQQHKYKNKIFYISVINNNFSNLISYLNKNYYYQNLITSQTLILANIEQINQLEKIINQIDYLFLELKKNITTDLVSIILKDIYHQIAKLLGIDYEKPIIEQLFAKFCLGK